LRFANLRPEPVNFNDDCRLTIERHLHELFSRQSTIELPMAYAEERPYFTVGVFQDAAWARRGLEALARHGFSSEALSIIAKESPETATLAQQTFGVAPSTADVRGVGPVVAHGPLVKTLQGESGELSKAGIAATMRRAGFQVHDGFIFETLTARGGILVAIESEPRAADALAVLHAYGGGNAAIGAWVGRV
jgi:hypothetical protein